MAPHHEIDGTKIELMSMFDNKKAWGWSVAGHGLILAVSLIAFVAQPHRVEPAESVTVDLISIDQLQQGTKSGQKDAPKPLVEKVAEIPKKIDDPVGKIDKKTVETETAPAPAPETPKPVEKKPEPPKPVAEKPKDEPKKAEKKPEPKEQKIDPIAEALKKEEAKKPTPKQEAKAPAPKPEPKRDYQFDSKKLAALIDKRAPSREAIAGETLNNTAALGGARGAAANNSATWGAMFKQQVERCWTKPYGGEKRLPMVSIIVRLGRDGTLQAQPRLEQPASDPTLRAYQETAIRAMLQCQPYRLPPTMYEGEYGWNYFTADFVDESRV